jgi:adenine-specific DNA-methyltransferase
VNSARLDRLRKIFPEAFTEGKIDFEKFQQVLSGDVTEAAERYGLSWTGKSEAIKNIQTLTSGTLLPARDESVNFDATENLIIEGDNLEVLKLLQGGYHGRVKMIYIDPPYNIGSDFIYPDNYKEGLADYLKFSGQVSGEGVKLTTNPETDGRYHSKWLTMMYPRLFLARNLLREDGVIFVSIDDHEIHNLRGMMNEIFGEENFIATLIWNKQHSQQQGLFKQYHEYVVLYARSADRLENIQGGEGEIDAGALKKISRGNPASNFEFPAGVRFEAPDDFELTGTFGDSEKVTVVSGRMICRGGKTAEKVTLRAGWTQKNQMISLFSGKETFDSKGQKVLEFYFNSTGKLKCRKVRSKVTPPTLLPEYGMVSAQTEYIKTLFGDYVFDNPKPVKMLRDFIEWFTVSGDIVLDFFAGIGTTADAVLRSNSDEEEQRSVILVQLPQPVDENSESGKAAKRLGYKNIFQLCRDRVFKVKQKLDESRNSSLFENGSSADLGFKVFKLCSSNFKVWDAASAPKDAAGLAEQLKLMSHNVVENRGDEALLYELILKSNLPLTSKIQSGKIGAHTFYDVADGALAICLERKLTLETLRGIIARKPKGVICLDIAFAGNDQLKTNIVLEMKSHGIEFHTA